MGDEAYRSHDGALVLLLIVTGLTAAVWLTIGGIRRLSRTATRRTSPLGASALLAWGAAICVYTWGLILLMLTDDYGQSMACNDSVGHSLIGYEPTFVPLGFGCATDDGRVVEAIIPPAINRLAALFAFCALVLTGLRAIRQKKGTHT
ncbi:hypothetical protein [Streptomyces marincola]|uniref:Uncharacterized protein n=1 Tax=Streptomyces marincola TaxID=2878388 RepID=A0A1W7CWA0_9ACTN|nr:hypothetical protein [Streptomyces marincola]ARQ69068.1 hypothetical protein CAG99_09500 [Streptomyces marincola]